MPVQPDDLGLRLEAYLAVVPILHTLRLCHRFRKGPDVRVTKLPAELVLDIESLIIKDKQIRPWYLSNWKSAFMHFESRCHPMFHLEDCYSPFDDGASYHVDLCASCSEGDRECTWECEKGCQDDIEDPCWTCAQEMDPDNCVRTCDAEYDYHMGRGAHEMGWRESMSTLEQDCEGWKKLIDQSEDGNFAKFDRVRTRFSKMQMTLD